MSKGRAERGSDNSTSTTSHENNDREVNWLCCACNMDLHSEAESLGCDGLGCNKWFHPLCVTSDAEFTELSSNPNSKWLCKECSTLPCFTQSNDISSAKWGNLVGNDIINKLNHVFGKVVTWKPNLFKLPSGASGKAFIVELTRLINLWTNKTTLECTALTSIHTFVPLMLQKPSKSSKNRDHIRHLLLRLDKWQKGEFLSLLEECEAIQKRLINGTRNPENIAKVFARLMLHGKVAAALRWLGSNRPQLLDTTPDVLEILKKKHPNAAPPCHSHLITDNPLPKVQSVIFENIDAEAIHRAAMTTKGSAGPSGVDSDTWRRFLCSRSFNRATDDAYEAVAGMCRRLCTEFVDPTSLQALLSCRLIPLDKNPGVRPIGVGEVLRRIIGKTVTTFIKGDIINAV